MSTYAAGEPGLLWRLRRRARAWCVGHALACAGIGLGGVVLSALVITIAVNARPLLGIVGVAISALGLWFVNLSLLKFDEHPVSEMRGPLIACIVAGLVLVALGLIIIAQAFVGASALWAAIGALIGAVGLVLASKLMLVGSIRPERWVAVGVLVGVLGLASTFVLDLHWTYDLVPILVGFALYRIGIRPLLEGSTTTTKRCTSAGLAATLVGLALLLVGSIASELLLPVLGLFLLVFGLTPLSIGWERQGVRPMGPGVAIVIGLVVTILGFFFWPKESPDWLPLIAAIVIAALGVSFSARGEGFFILALVGLALVWVLADRADEAPLDPNPEAAGRILALGDSYTSGEGSTAFFPGTNVEGEHRNECRRSSTAYPYLVATQLHMGLDLFACSGATAIQIHKEPQMDKRSPPDIPGSLPQLENPYDKSKVSLVLVSIGGNDAGFGKVGIACVLPGSCDALREHWLVHVGRIGQGLTEAYTAIKAAVGDSTPIVAIPYPLLLREEGCGWSALNASEHDFLAEFIAVVDDRVRKSAEEAGINFFEPGLFAFEGARICDGEGPDDTVMNFFNFHPAEGAFIDRVNPTNWVHGTFHPKPSGHEAIAAELVPWLRTLLAEIDVGQRPPNPDPNPDATFSVRRVNMLETVLIDPRTLPSASLKCRVDHVPAFATLLPLIDATDSFTLNASRRARVCYTLPDGTTWTDQEEGVVMRDGGEVRIQPQLPEQGFQQRFIYKDATDHTWQLRIVEFCKVKPRCPSSPGAWMAERLLVAARATVPPAILVFIGAWLLGLGVRRKWGELERGSRMNKTSCRDRV